ncbi:hypothetical protein GGX14DRAFT_509131 [Mycena pura]|uniref:RRN7-type domain-containing protein n=1 Tax=Mycena pura TaxID=153505 RepID=A0AAD6YT00_9AGAR|nr:hypothetical protein GGX14DRAFT_509131 [Mycena pura]
MAPRKRCPVCRSKQWHKEPSSGLISCSEGHILQNYRNESSEVDQVGPHSLKKRTLKKKKKKVGTSSHDPKLYHGNRGRFFYFQCLQVILQNQVAVLTERWALPSELEVVCKDLWALHLTLMRDQLPAEPYVAAHDSEEETSDTNDLTTILEERENASSPDIEVLKAPSSDEQTDDAENDAELDELLAENSASESSDSEDEIDPTSLPSRSRGKRNGLHKYEQSVSTLAVIVLAFWTLRVPILYRDLLRLIESYELPYLEAVRVLPPSMTVHLTKYNIQALSPPNTPSALVLHKFVSSLARRIHSSFGVMTPEVNAAPILWRAVTQCLGGSPTLYRLTKRLSGILSLPLTLHHSLAPRLQRIKARDPESHKYDNVAPELAFVATGVIVLKLVYGLDTKARLPDESEDPASDMAGIDEYLELLKRLDDTDGKTRDAEFDSKRAMAIENLSDDTVDEYLTFCEQALVMPANGKQAAEEVLGRYFPFQAKQMKEKMAVTERLHFGLGATELQKGEAVLRPGEEYALCQSAEMPDGYAAVVARAAEWVGVREEYVCAVVENYERRLWRWWQGARRRGEREGALESDE